MKRCGLIALLFVAPIAAMAQLVVFTDNFTSSTTNKTSISGGTPFNSFTSYDIAGSKSALTNISISNGDFRIQLDGTTSSGLLEAQGVFAKSPITLISPGDYITLTYIFKMTNGLPAATAYLGQGLYNSAGATPLTGNLNGGGLGGAGFTSGNCASWQGYFSRIFSASNNVYTRPIQTTATTSAAQDLVGNGVTGGFNGPGPDQLTTVNTSTITINPGQIYTVSYTIELTDTNTPTLTITNTLYDGAGTGGTVLSTATATATGADYLTNSFDGLCLGRREAGSVPVRMDVTNLTITVNISTAPGQPYDVTGGGIGCPSINSFPVGLDGSVLGNDYYLYTNGVWTGIFHNGTGSALTFPPETVLNVPLTNTVIASNTVTANTGPMLGIALVGPDAPPVVTNQPVPCIVANGSIGVFSLASSGGGLTYQWFKNSGTMLTDGGNISGSATSTLVISPVGPGDAANYYCTITSGCGNSTNSFTNSLTINGAANLTWQGNTSSNWDLAITPNFVGPVVFHNGDNVTLSDNPTTLKISIIGNYIAPTSINDNSGQSYAIFGPGTINGPGSLTMSGSGILSLNNSNAYSGGTIISSGRLILTNQNFGAGTGPVTLSGGALEFPFKQANSAGFSNNINVTASSTLNVDTNGTFACVLNGQITGNPGTTLTVNAANVNTGTARLRLYGQFTNNSSIVLSGSADNVEFAPYLPSGNQVFNGIISGTVGKIVPRGAGSVILNNSGSTFVDASGNSTPNNVSLLMSSGNVGIGADSVQSSPPTVDSGPVGVGLVAINSNTNSEGGTCSFFASGGAHTIANQIIYTTTTNTVSVVFGGTNALTFTGEFDLANTGDPNGTNRTLDVTNNAATTFAGVISDNSANDSSNTVCGLIKTGGGPLYLNATNTYVGPTTNLGGLLSGSGVIIGSVTVSNGASIGGGSAASIGTLTISNSLTLSGDVSVRVNNSGTPANDVIFVTGSLVNNGVGTVTVNNLGPALVAGNTFHIFNKAVSGGGSLTVTGGGSGVNWNNNLATDGSISVQSIGPSGPTTNASITHVSLSGTNILVHGTNNNVPNTSFHFQVFTSTNVALPLSSWTPGATLPFNNDGTFDYTNPIVPGTPRQFIDVKAVP